MPYTSAGTITRLTTEWQYTDPLEGEYFRLRHFEAPNGGLYAIAQAVINADGTIQLFDSQVLAYERKIIDTLRLKKPGWATERRLAFKKLPKQPTLEEELRRLLLPGFLQIQPQDPFNFVRKSEWRVDIEVSDYITPISSNSTNGNSTSMISATHWRVKNTDAPSGSGGQWVCREIVFNNNTDITSGGTAIASFNEDTAAMSFDKNNATYWNGGGVGTIGAWIGYIFPSKISISSISITNLNQFGNIPPTSYDVEVSTDNGVTWSKVWSFSIGTDDNVQFNSTKP